jgi:hypothetical protein
MTLRTVLLCITIVAAFELHPAAAASTTERVPVSPAVVALAEHAGLDLARDRAGFVPELIRLLYTPPASRQTRIVVPTSPRVGPNAPQVIVPLTAVQWSDTIFHRRIAPEQLLDVIVADRRASLLCRGLAAADDETLAYYADHPALLAAIYEHGSPAFTAFAGSVRVHGGRLVVPGGDIARVLWETAAHAAIETPDAFLRALFLEPEARLAYLFDVLATTTPEARAFALGLWIDDEEARTLRFQSLVLAVRTTVREWHVDELPFGRPLNDLAILLLRVKIDSRGGPLPPADRRFWASALGVSALLDGPVDARVASHTRIDAAWLLLASAGDMYARGEKLDQVAFGQRVFGSIADSPSDEAAAIVRELPARRMLLLGIERMGITNPAVYAGALRQARVLQEAGGERFWTLAQLQGSLALIARMRLAGTIGVPEAEALVRSLSAVPIDDGEFRGALATWFQSSLSERLPPGDTWQARTIAAVAGGPTPGRPQVEWEGQLYRLDLAFAERRRIEEIRRRQGGVDLDLAFNLVALGRRISQAPTIEAMRPLTVDTRQVIADAGARLARSPATMFAPGVIVPRDGREWLMRAADEMDRAVKAGDVRRAIKAGDSIVGLSDVVLGTAMASLVYAVHLGDPEGPALLGANVALRHDFGLGRRDGESRTRLPWAVPRQDFQPGVPWHVVGSLVGLDLALAPLSLHRLSMDGLAEPPRLPSIEREAFATNVALLNPRALSDLDRDRIVVALRGGRVRLRALVAQPAGFEQLTEELALDGWRVRALRWVLKNEPDSLENQFSLAELLRLGSPGTAFDAWGASGLVSFGCVCTRFPAPRTWRILAGRTQVATMAAVTVDMNLELAERLAELRLPAALLPSVLATAMQDFADRVMPVDSSDVTALVRYARTISRDSLADYVAAAATLDGPLVAEADGLAER